MFTQLLEHVDKLEIPQQICTGQVGQSMKTPVLSTEKIWVHQHPTTRGSVSKSGVEKKDTLPTVVLLGSPGKEISELFPRTVKMTLGMKKLILFLPFLSIAQQTTICSKWEEFPHTRGKRPESYSKVRICSRKMSLPHRKAHAPIVLVWKKNDSLHICVD